MYGHQFFQASNEKRVKFINTELEVGRFDSLEELAEAMFLNVTDLKEELFIAGYAFVPQINKFARFELDSK
jgi:hypothetical protein